MNTRNLTTCIAALAFSIGLACSTHAAVVWNVNIGNEIDETDNFLGAATENTANSTWNSITGDRTGMALKNSTDAVTNVTLDINAGGVATFPETGQLEIFDSYTTADVVLTLKGLDNSATYDLIIYSDWKWEGGTSGYPVTQIKGSGITTIYVNTDVVTDGSSHSLVEDTNPSNSVNQGNWFRITGLTPNGSGELEFRGKDGVNAGLSGFQLIDTTIPEPSTAILASLGLMGVCFRRKRRA